MVAELMFVVTKAWYENNMICLRMSDRQEIRFQVELNKKLMNASDRHRSDIKIICAVTGLHWPDLDEDLSVNGIIEGRLGY